MSDAPKHDTTDAARHDVTAEPAATGSATDAQPATPPRRRGRWRRRVFKLFVWLVAIAVVLRIALYFAMPWLVGLGASAVGLRAEYERLDLSLTTGELSLWHLEVRGEEDEADATTPAPIELEYLIVDLDVAALFGGQIRVRRVEVDGLDVRARLRADGTIDLQELFASSDPAAPAPEPAPAEPAEEAAIDPSLPLLVDAVRLQRVHAHLIDESVSPAVTRRIDVDVRVSDLGSDERPCRIQTQVTSLDVIDLAAFDARVVPTGSPEAPGLEVDAMLRVDGVQLGVLEPWLAPFGVRPVARELDAGADLRIVLERPDPTALPSSLELTIAGAHVTADDQDAVRMDQLVVRVDGMTTRQATLTEARADHLRAFAEQRPDGALRVAGLDLLPAEPGAEPPASPPPPAPAEPAPTPRPTDEQAPAFRFGLGTVTFTDGLATFVDGSVTPAARFEARLDSLTATGDPAKRLGADSEFALELRAAAPGLVEAIGGTFRITPLGMQQTLDGSLELTGIDPERAAAHLAAAGLESTFESGTLRAKLHGEFGLRGGDGLRASLALTEVALTDGDSELLALDDVSLGPVTLRPAADADAAGRVAVDTIDIRGFRLPLRRDADGALHVAGLRTIAAPAPTTRRPPATSDATARETDDAPPADAVAADIPAAPAPAPRPAPRIELGRLTLRDAGIRFLDESLASPLDLQVGPLEVDVENLGLGGVEGSAEPTESRIRAQLVCEQLARQLVVAGTLTSAPGPLDVRTELDLNGEGLHLEPLADLLATLNLEPNLREGRLSGKLTAAAKQVGAALTAEVALTDLGLHDGDQRLVGVDRVAVAGVQVDPERGTTIASVDVTGPFVQVARDAEGGLLAAGIRVAPPTPAAETARESAATSDSADAPDAPPSAPDAAATPFALDRLTVADARMVWSDAAVTPAVDALTLVAGVELLDFSTAATAPLRFEIDTSIDAVLESLAIRGEAELGGERLAARLAIDGRGLRAGPLATYLPPGIELTLQDGRLAATAELDAGPADDGGNGLLARLSEVALRDGTAGEPLFALQELVVDAPRIDPEGGTVLVKSLAVRGVELDARRTDASALEFLGLRLDAATAPPEAEAAATSPEGTPPTVPAVAQAMRDDGATAPRIVVEQLDLGVARFGFQDETVPGATPLTASIHLTNPEPLVLYDDELEELPALALRIEAGAAPVIGSATIDIVTTPFGIDPHAKMDILVEGISGNGLTRVVPDLAEVLDGSGLEGGRFKAAVDVTGRVRRRGPLEFDLGAGIGVEATVRDVTFQATPDGEVLAGFEELFVDARRITPDGGAHIAQIALDHIVGRARQDRQGLHLLGLVLKTPPPADPNAAPAPAPTAPAADPEARPGPAAPAGDAPSGPPLRIDEIAIHGADLVIEEETGSELTRIPIDALDLEIRDLRLNSGPPSPIRFSLAVGGGNVDLPERQLSSSPLAGLLEAAGRAVVGANDDVPIEQRLLFEEISVQGQVTPGPEPSGRIKTSLAGFELGALRGAAEGSGVTIGDGVLDAGIDVRLEGRDGIRVDSTFTFAHLDLSEPPGGPIQTYLKLPAPLQTVLFVLRNDRREQVIPVGFRLDSSGISAGQIASTATTALAAVLADAIVSSPFRIGGSLTDLVGLTGQEVAVDLPTFALDFEPADASLDFQDLAVIRQALDAARENDEYALVLVHRLAAPDATKVHELVNPPSEAVRALARRLRQSRDELTRARAETAAEARAHHMIGREAEAREAVQRLQGLDREIGRLEASLDRLLERLRPGSDRRADRRALEASVGLGRSRLQQVEQALREMAGKDFAERIELRVPRSEVVEDLQAGEVQLLIRIRRES